MTLNKVEASLIWSKYKDRLETQHNGCIYVEGRNKYTRPTHIYDRQNNKGTSLIRIAMLAEDLMTQEQFDDYHTQTRHMCNDITCVNTTHICLGDASDNLKDAYKNGKTNQYASKTHCPQGHEYNDVNTRLYQGRRYCVICQRERAKQQYLRKKTP